MNIARLLERIALADPSRPALYEGPRLVADHGALLGQVGRLAGALAARGLEPGERVALVLRNRAEYLQLLYAALWAGLVVVPINAKLHAREVEYIVGHSEAKLLLADAESAQGVEPPAGVERLDAPDWVAQVLGGSGSAAPAIDCVTRLPDDLAWLFYTSGTTGRPKGVMLTHRSLTTMALCFHTDVDAVDAADAVLYAAPFSHGAGIYTFPYMAAGARHVFPPSGGFEPAELLALAARFERLSLFAAPTMVHRLVEHVRAHGGDGRGLKTIVYGGGPMYVADLERAREYFGARFVQIYGQGESPMTITVLPRAVIEASAHPRWRERLASVGFRQAAVDVRVVDENDRPLPAGAIGEVVVRGDSVMKGYWRDPEASAQALRGGWLHTGDLGSLDDEGFLTLKDRSKDLVISGGSNIYPREVEEVLLRHPQLGEVAVIGVPDPEWGESVVAYIVPAAGVAVEIDALARELDLLCLEHIARFKRPKRYLAIDRLPKNNYGKVLKTELRARYAALVEAGGR